MIHSCWRNFPFETLTINSETTDMCCAYSRIFTGSSLFFTSSAEELLNFERKTKHIKYCISREIQLSISNSETTATVVQLPHSYLPVFLTVIYHYGRINRLLISVQQGAKRAVENPYSAVLTVSSLNELQ